jgi:phosphoglycolate phosphatase-like HAD superfamily hydrolase
MLFIKLWERLPAAIQYRKNMNNKNLIIFDMDGVIIDVSGSYRDVVRQTTNLFFRPAQSWETLPQPLFELSDLAAVKQSGGLNNDWDLTCAVINLLYSLTPGTAIHESQDPWTRWQETLSQCDLKVIADFLTSMDQPLTTLLENKGKPANDFIAGLYAGDVGTGNIIKQIFQELYLGDELFQHTYDLKPKIYSGEGYILREKVLIDRSVLEDLGRNNMLAIATGRPRTEAEYPLSHFDLKKYFNLIYTLDDCLQEEQKIFKEKGETVSFSKPHPFMLDAIAASLKDKFSGYYYVGDMPDDMLAAANSRFGFKSIGITVSAPDKPALENELRLAGADYLVEKFYELKSIFL